MGVGLRRGGGQVGRGTLQLLDGLADGRRRLRRAGLLLGGGVADLCWQRREGSAEVKAPGAAVSDPPSCATIRSVTLRPASLISLTMSACGMLTMGWLLTARMRSPTFSLPQRSAGLPSMMRPILCGTAALEHSTGEGSGGGTGQPDSPLAAAAVSGRLSELMMTKPKPSLSFRLMTTSLGCAPSAAAWAALLACVESLRGELCWVETEPGLRPFSGHGSPERAGGKVGRGQRVRGRKPPQQGEGAPHLPPGSASG